VARDIDRSASRCPADLARYDPKAEGRTGADVEAWGQRALTWLDADGTRRHPLGNRLGILRECVRLKNEAWFIGSNGKTAAETIADERMAAGDG
jgi:hypothetical protein